MSTSPNDDLDARDSDATRELLEEAHTLAMQIERVLASPSCQMSESEAFRVRLARAHTLSLLDQLAELLAPRLTRDSSPPQSPPLRDDGDSVSGVRRASWLR